MANEEEEVVLKFQKLIADHADCLNEVAFQVTLTGSSWIVDATKGLTLLTHHRKLNKWLQLGGHADGLSDVFLVALKEAQEEFGLQKIHPLSEEIFDVDIHLVPETSL